MVDLSRGRVALSAAPAPPPGARAPGGAPTTWLGRRVVALRVGGTFGLYMASTIILTLGLGLAAAAGVFAVDFQHSFVPAVHEFFAGRSPYAGIGDAELAEGTAFVYPPIAAVLFAPFVALGAHAGAVVFTVVLAASAAATLWLLGVRDARCFAAVGTWGCVYAALQTANVTLILALGTALAWRMRKSDSSGLILGVLVALKLFLWPLALWLLVMRRYKAAGYMMLSAGAAILVPWGAIGFAGFRGYPAMLQAFSRLKAPQSYTVAALEMDGGLSGEAARALVAVIAAAVLLWCLYEGRRGNDRAAFILAIAACLILSPILWLHYFALLIVPLALSRPRFSAVWLAPAVMWLGAGTGNGAPWQTALVLLVFFVVIGGSLRPSDRRLRVAEANTYQPLAPEV